LQFICGCDANPQLQEVMTGHSNYDMNLSIVYDPLRKLRMRDYVLRTVMMISLLYYMTPCRLVYKLQGFGEVSSIFNVNSPGTTFKMDAISPSTQDTRRRTPVDGNRICTPHQILFNHKWDGLGMGQEGNAYEFG
jgi:hypothetical protein